MEPNVTCIEREHFSLCMPFAWMAAPSNNPLEFEFRNKTLKEQLIVTVMIARKPFDNSMQQWVAKDLASKRVSAHATLSNGKAACSPARFKSAFGQVEARCFGRDEPHEVRFAFVVKAAAAKVVMVAITRYFLKELGTPFEEYADSIFDLLQIKNPAE